MQDQVRLYESLADADSYFSENQKKMILENAVASVKFLRAIKDQADKIFAHTGKLLDYDQHSKLLLSAEASCDSQSISASDRSSRKFYHTELGGSDFETDSPSEVTEDLEYDADASSTTLLAIMTNRGNYNSNIYLPSEAHALLTPKEKDLW